MKKIIAGMLLGAGFCFSVQAATATWNGPVAPTTGTADGSWLTGTNWVGSVTPVFNNTLDITYTNGGMSWIGNQNPTIRSLTFADSVDTDINLRVLNNGSIGAKNLTFGSAGGAAINIAAGATGKINIGQGSNGGIIVLAEDLSITHNGDGSLSFLKRVDGSGGIVKRGSGKLILAVSNSYTGVTTLNAGALDINNTNALGTGVLVIDGGTIDNTSAATISNANNNAVTINGNFAFTGTQDLDLGAGVTTLGTAAGTSRTITANGANTLTLGGIIANGTTANQLIKDGLGTLSLNGANTYNGATIVLAGVLIANADHVFAGSTNIAVASGATLTLTNGAENNYINDSASLILTSGSILNLNFSGKDTVSRLSLDNGATWLSNGTYTAAQLAALGAGGTYTGTGSLKVGKSVLRLIGITSP
ncbi:MAG: autotransporter-associated beta strand repeat-containing protein [Kiritimatiellales bacterium]|jgi:autotransporter-associated beta strand protein